MSETQTYENEIQRKVNDFRSAKDEIVKRMEKANDKLTSKAEDAWEDFVELVKKHPAKALGIALATGATLGTLAALSKRRQYSASSKLKEVAGTGVDAWARVKEGFEEAVCTLKEAVDDAASKFK